METYQKNAIWICCDPFAPVPLNPKKSKRLVIGRHKNSDFQLPHSCVSRSHAVLKSINDRCILLEDLKSANGTFVNGKKISTYPLEVGDIVQIGPYELEIKTYPFSEEAERYNATNTNFLTTSKATAMAGQIEKTSLVEVLQNIEFHSKTGTLYVESKDKDGFLIYVSGRPIKAQFGNSEDVEAILAMLKLIKGNFIITDKVEMMDTGIEVSITSILLEYSRLQDESSDGF